MQPALDWLQDGRNRPSGIKDRRGKRGCNKRLPVDEEEEELVLEGDKEDEMVLEGDEEDELVLERDKEKERGDLRNEKDKKKKKKSGTGYVSGPHTSMDQPLHSNISLRLNVHVFDMYFSSAESNSEG